MQTNPEHSGIEAVKEWFETRDAGGKNAEAQDALRSNGAIDTEESEIGG